MAHYVWTLLLTDPNGVVCVMSLDFHLFSKLIINICSAKVICLLAKLAKTGKKPVFIHKRIEDIVCCSLAPPALSDGQGLSSVGYRLSEMKILERITLSFTELICSYFIVSLIRVRSY